MKTFISKKTISLSNLSGQVIPKGVKMIPQVLTELFQTAIQITSPSRLVAEYVDKIPTDKPLLIVAFGKAAETMLLGVYQSKAHRDLIEQALVVARDLKQINPFESYTLQPKRLQGNHPVPGPGSEAAGKAVVDFIYTQTHPGKRLVLLVSGGGSSLTTAPREPLSMADLTETTRCFIRSKADISQLNTVRKHLTQCSGGKLADLSQSPITTLILSDVIGDPLSIIASGPVSPDPSTYKDALKVIHDLKLGDKIPGVVMQYLERGVKNSYPETPKKGEPCFNSVTMDVIGNNEVLLKVFGASLAKMGQVTRLEKPYEMTVSEATTQFCDRIEALQKQSIMTAFPQILVGGGELTVDFSDLGDKKPGEGGRATEFVLRCALELKRRGIKGVTLFSVGSDGSDGPDSKLLGKDGHPIGAVAGAWAYPDRVDPQEAKPFLARHDSRSYFHHHDQLVVTGSTGNNLNDVFVAYIQVVKPQSRL